LTLEKNDLNINETAIYKYSNKLKLKPIFSLIEQQQHLNMTSTAKEWRHPVG
jgi:hypothetical protein